MRHPKGTVLDVRGKVNIYFPENDINVEYVFQKTWPRLKNRDEPNTHANQVRRHVAYEQANSLAQIASRQKLADAVSAWQAMDAEAREEWKNQADGKALTGFNLFVKSFIKSSASG